MPGGRRTFALNTPERVTPYLPISTRHLGQDDAVRRVDLVWNRACFHPEALSLPGDRALADMLLAHGYAMNGGVLHAVQDLEPDQLDAALSGYRYFGLTAALELMEDARTRIRQGLDDDAADRLESESDARYGEVGTDAVLAEAFERHYEAHPENFAPLSAADEQPPEWV